MTPIRAITVLGALAALVLPRAASACAPTDWTCQAVWACYAPGSFPAWTAYYPCDGTNDVCVAVNHGLPLANYVSCTDAGASQSKPTWLDAFLAAPEGPGVGGGSPPSRGSVVERDEVLRILNSEATTPGRRDAGVSDVTEVTR